MRRRLGWTLLAGVLFYLASYAAVRYAYLPHRLQADALQPDWQQTLYARTFYPLRWLTARLDPPADETQFGTLIARQAERLQLEFGDSLSHIGFRCSASACAELARVPIGSEIELRLGWALSDDDRFINRLIGVHRCVAQDAICVAARQRETARLAELLRRSRALEQQAQAEWATCEVAIAQDMSAIGFGNESTPTNPSAERRQQLDGQRRSDPAIENCTTALGRKFRRAAYDSCMHRGCDRVGGGCFHQAPWFADQRALALCAADAASRQTGYRH